MDLEQKFLKESERHKAQKELDNLRSSYFIMYSKSSFPGRIFAAGIDALNRGESLDDTIEALQAVGRYTGLDSWERSCIVEGWRYYDMILASPSLWKRVVGIIRGKTGI